MRIGNNFQPSLLFYYLCEEETNVSLEWKFFFCDEDKSILVDVAVTLAAYLLPRESKFRLFPGFGFRNPYSEVHHLEIERVASH